jgi:hypothetical protein
MKAYEFPVKVSSEGTLELSENILKVLPPNQVVRVIILVNEPQGLEEQDDWGDLTIEQFFGGYNDKDAAYDKL